MWLRASLSGIGSNKSWPDEEFLCDCGPNCNKSVDTLSGLESCSCDRSAKNPGLPVMALIIQVKGEASRQAIQFHPRTSAQDKGGDGRAGRPTSNSVSVACRTTQSRCTRKQLSQFIFRKVVFGERSWDGGGGPGRRDERRQIAD